MDYKVDLPKPRFYHLKYVCYWLVGFGYFIVIPALFEIPDSLKGLHIVAPFLLFCAYAWWTANKQPVQHRKTKG